jgi:DnaK suppressor protein
MQEFAALYTRTAAGIIARPSKARRRRSARMPAKKPASKALKVKKPASKPAAKKVAAAPRKHMVKAKMTAPKKPAVTPPPAKKAAPAARPGAALTAHARDPIKVTPAPSPERPVATRPVTATALVRPPRAAPAGAANEAEDGDSHDPTGLLAGPRNVQPYIPKRGEQYMNKEQLEHFRQILLNWKRDLMEEVDRTVSHMQDEAANFPDPNDRATQEEEFSLELRTRDRERKLIRKIDEALKRIDGGSYGYCLETGEEIGIKRLEARPVATLSIEAQERRERRERQYGDRDDRYR